MRTSLIWTLRTFTSSITYGPLEFLLAVLASDQIAPQYGEHQLEDFFKETVKKQEEEVVNANAA